MLFIVQCKLRDMTLLLLLDYARRRFTRRIHSEPKWHDDRWVLFWNEMIITV